MNISNQPLSYNVFVILDFYDQFLKRFEDDSIDDNTKNVIRALFNKLVDYEDPMLPIEDLASVHAASEITIFISDLIERSTILDPEEFVQTLGPYSEDLKDLIVLLAEEEDFLAGLSEFLGNENITANELDVETETPDGIDDFENQVDIAHPDSTSDLKPNIDKVLKQSNYL